MSLPIPSTNVLIKLGSLAVHVDEFLGKGGHAYDIAAIRGLLTDPEVKAWLAKMDALALLPVKR